MELCLGKLMAHLLTGKVIGKIIPDSATILSNPSDELGFGLMVLYMLFSLIL